MIANDASVPAMRREIRDLTFLVQGLAELWFGRDNPKIHQAAATVQFREAGIDGLVHVEGLPTQAFDAIRALWEGHKHVTLTDLTYFTRKEVAVLRGVGPKAMAALDAALAEAGLSWVEPGEVS